VEGCPVEEETPPAWHKERITVTTQLVNAPQPVATSEPETPNTCSFSEEHLQLIFDMRRDMADQLHCQDILIVAWMLCLILFQASLSSVDARPAANLMYSLLHDHTLLVAMETWVFLVFSFIFVAMYQCSERP
jgi:hypothetical protein